MTSVQNSKIIQKKLWKIINNATKGLNDKSSVIDSINVNNIEITEGKQIAEEFAKYFASIGMQTATKGGNPKNNIGSYINKIPNNKESVFLTPCTIYEIKKLISELPNKYSSGYDNINNVLLKSIKDLIVHTLSIIFNRSLCDGIFPEAMKLAEVVPLFKSGSRLLLNNYWPISLLPTISKILEKVVYSRIYSFLIKHNILFKSQYGFCKKHSCEHAVTELIGEICKGLDQGKHTIALFIDLSKAFDTIDHNILFHKLYRYGIRGTALNWFRSYLEHRSIRAKCEVSSSGRTEYSNTENISIGTLQGSCLGPLIFLIFCNDIYLNLKLCSGILFADDTTIYNSHQNFDYLCWSMYHDLILISDSFKANHLSVNYTKTVGILFNNNKKLVLPELWVDNMTIRFVDHTKFLGIWIDHHLNWKEHLSRLAQKIKRNMYLLKQGKNLLSVHSKQIFYFAQNRSHLTYGLSTWGNMLSSTAINTLQNLQNKCIAQIKQQYATIKSYKELQILRMKNLLELENCKLGFKLMNHELPPRIIELTNSDQFGNSLAKTHSYNTRN